MAKKKNSPKRSAHETVLSLGQLCATPAALALLSAEDIQSSLARHSRGDWGDVCAEDKQLNDMAMLSGTRILSAYKTKAGVKFWIITEADRSVTTVLLPEDY